MILLYLCTFLWAKFDTEFIIISALHQAKLWLTHLAAGSSRLWESCVSVMFSVSCSSCGWVVVGSGNLATGAAGNKYPVPRRVWAADSSREEWRLCCWWTHSTITAVWSITSYHLSSLVTNPHFHIHVTDRSIAQKWLEHRTSEVHVETAAEAEGPTPRHPQWWHYSTAAVRPLECEMRI